MWHVMIGGSKPRVLHYIIMKSEHFSKYTTIQQAKIDIKFSRGTGQNTFWNKIESFSTGQI